MTPLRSAFAAGLLAAVLSSCSGAATPDPGPTAPASAAPGPTPAGSARTGEEGQVEGVFRSYYEALLARDFGTACTLSAPETKAALLKNLKSQGGITATSCEDAFGRIYGVPAAAEAADKIAETAEVTDVTVTGDQATLTWTAEIKDQRPTVNTGMRRISGDWLLLDTGS
jgi:hypothetical protein